jgi:hypothetical protein
VIDHEDVAPGATAAEADALRDLVLDLICLGPLGLALAGEPCDESTDQAADPAARALAAIPEEEPR